MTEPQIVRADFALSAEAIRTVREEVFIEEQGVTPELEWDGLDAEAVHVLACTADGTPVGTARLLADGHIGRMAVRAAWRGRGVGRALLAELIAIARERGLARVFLGAQTHAVGFYERQGFVVYGEPFMDAGIPHRHMARELSPRAPMR
ncbi:MAG: GNAT family N-acetyltransferase [Pseudolabrys sp.]|nr:GNAT family N-acetyltransferase [Gammaproteobacteria bacterium]